MACVHDESYPDFENVSLKCAAVEFGPKKRHQAVETLRKSPAEEWSAVKDVVEKFRLLRCRFAVRTLYELNKTAYSTERFYFKSQRPEIVSTHNITTYNHPLMSLSFALSLYRHWGGTTKSR
jgi:hypothetical protein